MLWSFQWFGSDMETVWNIWTEEDWVITVHQPVVSKHMSGKPAVRKTHEAGREERTESAWKEQNKTVILKIWKNEGWCLMLTSLFKTFKKFFSLIAFYVKSSQVKLGSEACTCLFQKLAIEQIIKALMSQCQNHICN